MAAQKIIKDLSLGSYFHQLIRNIGECRSKSEEDRIISQEALDLKRKLEDPKLDQTKMKQYLIRAIYIEMLGQDAKFAHITALNSCSSNNLVIKKVAYLAASLFFNHNSPEMILMMNILIQDLKSDNYVVVCAALTAATKLVNAELINAVLSHVTLLVNHQHELVRKKAILAIHRFIQLDPTCEGAMSGCDIDQLLRTGLCDKDPSVMAATLCALTEVAQQKPQDYVSLTPSLTSILKQILDRRLPRTYDYRKAPAAFIQIRLLRLLAVLGAGNQQASLNMYSMIQETIKSASKPPQNNISDAIILQAIITLTSIHPNTQLLSEAARHIGDYLRSNNANLRYMGLDALQRMVRINPKYATQYQVAVIECLEDSDESMRVQTMELLYVMTRPSNVEVIVNKMIEHLQTVSDHHQKETLVRKVWQLAEQYAPSNQWFMDTMTELFKLEGNLVQPEAVHRLMRLVAEQEEDLQQYGVQTYLKVIHDYQVPEVLQIVSVWVLGEYSYLARQLGSDSVTSDEVMTKLALLGLHQGTTDVVRGYILSAFAKIAAQSGSSLTSTAQSLLRKCECSKDTDLQQRALEVKALTKLPSHIQRLVLPNDEACEEFEDDLESIRRLSFLNGYVQSALNTGAAPYVPAEQREEMGFISQGMIDEATDKNQGKQLRFQAYERAQLPSMANPSQDITYDTRTQSARAKSSTVGASGVTGASTAVAQSDEPQLLIKSKGRQTWGPVQIAPPPQETSSSQVFDTAGQGSLIGDDVYQGTTFNQSTQPQQQQKEQQHVQSEKELLAASLFGDIGGNSGTRTPSSKLPSSSNKASRTPPPDTSTNLLLDMDAPQTSSSAPQQDPFLAISGLQDTQQVRAPTNQMQSLDIDDLLGGVSTTPASNDLIDTSGMGGLPELHTMGHSQGQQHMQNMTMMQPGMVQGQQQPMQQLQSQHGMQGQLSGSGMLGGKGGMGRAGSKDAKAPMAPTGKAAVENLQKKDPFGDLLN